MKLARTTTIGFALVAGWQTPAPAQSAPGADSLVLEPTQCYGTCPAYRLRIARDGKVMFQSRNPGDSTTATDSIDTGTLAELMRRADRTGIFALPQRIMDDRSICVDYATDHPTVTLTVFMGDKRDSVEDYLGCYQAVDHSLNDTLRKLRNFQIAVDSALRSARWVRPARMRRGRLSGTADDRGPVVRAEAFHAFESTSAERHPLGASMRSRRAWS